MTNDTSTTPSLTAVREKLEQVEPHRIKELKCWPRYYFAIESGIKPFEIRKNDRNYQADDVLWLREWAPQEMCPSCIDDGNNVPCENCPDGGYTGKELLRVVTYVTEFGQQPGFVVIGLALVTSQAADPVALQEEIARLKAEIAAAREACPSICMQDNFDAPLLKLVNLEVSRGFNRDAEVYRLSALLAERTAQEPQQ